MAKLTITIEAVPCNCGRGHHKPQVKISTAYDAEGRECMALKATQETVPALLRRMVGELIAFDTLADIAGAVSGPVTPVEADTPVVWPSDLNVSL